MRYLILIFILMFYNTRAANTAVLNQIGGNGESKVLNDYGEFNNYLSFNNNPVSINYLSDNKKIVEIGYVRLYNSIGYNLNSIFLNGSISTKYVNIGLGILSFIDSDSSLFYMENRLNIVAGTDYFIKNYVKNLNFAIGFNISLERLKILSDENIIDNNLYTANEINSDIGASYRYRNLRFALAGKNIFDSPYLIGGIGYLFSNISIIGISFKYINNNIQFTLSMQNSIIGDSLILYNGINSKEISAGIRVNIFNNIFKKKKMFLNYSINYNYELKDSHYLSIKYEF